MNKVILMNEQSTNNLLGHSMMMYQITLEFGTSVIQYVDVAKKYLGWSAPKTAMARLNDGTVQNLGLLVIRPTKSVALVTAYDLVEFLLKSRNVLISDY